MPRNKRGRKKGSGKLRFYAQQRIRIGKLVAHLVNHHHWKFKQAAHRGHQVEAICWNAATSWRGQRYFFMHGQRHRRKKGIHCPQCRHVVRPRCEPFLGKLEGGRELKLWTPLGFSSWLEWGPVAGSELVQAVTRLHVEPASMEGFGKLTC